MSKFQTCFELDVCKKDGIRFGYKFTLGYSAFKVIGYDTKSNKYLCRSLSTGETYPLSITQIKT
jgi:hypothetical protein